ncbi:amidohydrolase [Microbacterium fluvii]|uniref:Amidohydrolase n=1 Tax=Microbacterium fluvii TaxID=415215 RepID=A0ABW2H995_9MICO|nr:amidohydrolase [Microbacterium fluvii]MCU4671036.1 amidohydrolase [Microbacterium fluvii]
MPTADVLFTGGAIFTGAGEPLDGFAVAVVGDRIAALVRADETAALIGPATEVVDLSGALLSPGFQDAHVHPVAGGTELLQCNLADSADAAESIARVAAYALSHPDVEWILGGGWSMDHFAGGAPTRQALDAVVPDRPVLLMSRDHHSTWANTAAIRLAGIDRDTSDPVDGRIEREPDGAPAGTFHEGAGDLFAAARPAFDDELAYRGLLAAQAELIPLGITGWQDAAVRASGAGIPDPVPAYLRAAADGTLKVHVVGAQWWRRDGGIEQVEAIVAERDRIAELVDPRRVSLGAAKLMVDGVAENGTAAMLSPYHDHHGHPTDNSGLSFIDPELLREAVTALDAAGIQAHFHALGDRAVREALDAVAAARGANGPGGARHHLAHLQMIAESDVDRFAEHDAVANLQALWATHEPQLDELTLPFLPDGAESRHYPFGDLVRAGTRLAAGSDWPVSSADPMQAIHVAVNRTFPGSDAEPLGGAAQQIDLVTAMTAYTSGTAYVNGREHDTGSIREGYLANLVVLSPDPFAAPAEQLHRTTVLSTWIEGAPVYRLSSVTVKEPS